jgi:hypothetical protein
VVQNASRVRQEGLGMKKIRPVFIVGMNGSGTTMLADSLGFHPALFVFRHESRVLPYVIRKAQSYGDMTLLANRRRLADELGRAKPFWQANGRMRLVLTDRELNQIGFAETIDAVFMHFAKREGKARWGEKTPMNLVHVQSIAEIFPHAKFVHIIRDGRDAAQSFERRFGFMPHETIFRWRCALSEGQAQGAKLGDERYLELHYENLTAEPERWMQIVCEFLDLEFDPVVLTSSMRMAGPNLTSGVPRMMQNSGKWQDYFDATQTRALERIAGRKLRELGYFVSLEGAADPNRLLLLWWRGRGVLRRTIIHFRQRGLAGLHGYIKSIAVAVKQSIAGR